jgi:hypothetical protein
MDLNANPFVAPKVHALDHLEKMNMERINLP